jgi:hypothetical protein
VWSVSLINNYRNALYLFAAVGAIARIDKAYIMSLAAVEHVAPLQVTGIESIASSFAVQDVAVWTQARMPLLQILSHHETGADGVIPPQAEYLVVDSPPLG